MSDAGATTASALTAPPFSARTGAEAGRTHALLLACGVGAVLDNLLLLAEGRTVLEERRVSSRDVGVPEQVVLPAGSGVSDSDAAREWIFSSA